MKIQVTQDRIKRGIPCSAANCPVSIAIRETTGYECSTIMDQTTIYTETDYTKIPLGQKVREFIENFDCYLPVSPIEFDLDLSEISAALSGGVGSPTKLSPHGAKPYKPSRFWHFLFRRRHG